MQSQSQVQPPVSNSVPDSSLAPALALAPVPVPVPAPAPAPAPAPVPALAPVVYSAITGRYSWQGVTICGTVPIVEEGFRIPSIAEYLTRAPSTELDQYLHDAIKKHNRPP